MTGGRASRAEGDRVERELVALHKAIGTNAERYPVSGASRFRGAGHDLDVYAFGRDETPIVAEVKSRKSCTGFTTIERCLGHHVLFLKRNNADPIAVIPWRIWAQLLETVRA